MPQAKFAVDPAAYLQPTLVIPSATPAPPIAPAPGSAASYTCPMHREISQDHPGACLNCRMAIGPEMPAFDDGGNPELIDFRRRFWWTLPLTVAVFVLAAMQRADRNIGELLTDLGARFHGLRQSGIDEEPFDLLAGFDALAPQEAPHG